MMLLSTIHEQNPPSGLGGVRGHTDTHTHIQTDGGATGINNIDTCIRLMIFVEKEV